MELKLYEITGDYLQILDEIMYNEGEITPELEEALAINEENLYEKLQNYAKFIRHKEAMVDVRKAEIKRIGDLNKSDERTIENLKQRVEYAMNILEKDKVETSLFKFSFRKSSSIEITDENSVPEEFKTTETVVKISKTDIKNYLKENGLSEIAGAKTVEKKNLTIK